MMKTKDPKPFYLLWRVFAIFCLLVFNISFSQMTLVGNVSVINRIQDKDSVIYIASGTHIYDFDNAKKIDVRKTQNKKNQAISKSAKVLTKKKTVKTNTLKLDHNHQYLPYHNKEILITSTAFETISTINNDYHKKNFTIVESSYSYDVSYLFLSRIFVQYPDFELQSSNRKYKIRPPPAIV